MKLLRLVAVAIAAGALLSAQAAEPGRQPAIGAAAPAPLGVTRAGDRIEAGQFEGKVLVVSFWASWCGPCRAELPMLEGIQRVGGKERVQVVVVNIEERDQYRRIAKSFETLQLAFTHDHGKQASDAYGVKGIPHLLIIGRDGRLARRHVGYSEDSIEPIVQEINAALAKP